MMIKKLENLKWYDHDSLVTFDTVTYGITTSKSRIFICMDDKVVGNYLSLASIASNFSPI